MAEPNRAQGTAPWVVAALAGVLVAGLVLLLVRVLNVRHDQQRESSSLAQTTVGQLTGEQQTAVEAAATEATNLLTFSRKHFSADFARALKGATGSLRRDLAARRQATLSTMTKGKFDLRAKVIESAFESQTGSTIQVLLTVNGSNVDDAGQSTVASPQRLELTMVRSGGAWLASNLTSVGIE